ncbi:2'-5' RNA ligase [Saccharopolyspora lacisalsi]|uniref:2'-5' RNA ligase n=1 Tax=Halosaccharopolyspora lacisalsi TaxID=1000566 RepID=A0A839DW20_9PSEU|nr:2'-5' RNA ligase family protein [Halosaccharopolyspora lacisalsi]MBA8823371.1 2'-5' RNA ligase [Halosaccharopolyspora lacisalsi]
MRLFTALWPSTEAIRHLDEAVRAAQGQSADWKRSIARARGFRIVSTRRWHLTLCFHGDEADPDLLSRRLTEGLARLPTAHPRFAPPRLRLAGAGMFRSVMWIGVEPATEDDMTHLHALVEAAGGDPSTFRAHLTVARWAKGRPNRESLTELFGSYRGPYWSANEVELVHTDRESGTYRTVHRVDVVHGGPYHQA